jgi:uncharacterized membrane protein
VHGDMIVAGAGFLGALFDSLLGATVQGGWPDPKDAARWIETPVPGKSPERGFRIVNNDVVNLLCTLFSACLAIAAERIIY